MRFEAILEIVSFSLVLPFYLRTINVEVKKMSIRFDPNKSASFYALKLKKEIIKNNNFSSEASF